jgi:polysaccharide biosynthesis protein PslJ
VNGAVTAVAEPRASRWSGVLAVALVLAVGVSFFSAAAATIIVGTVALLVAIDGRVTAPGLLVGFVTVVMLLPAEFRLTFKLPVDASADRLMLLALLAAWALGLVDGSFRALPERVRATATPLLALSALGVLGLLLNAPSTIPAGLFAEDAKALFVLVTLVCVYFFALTVVRDRADVERVTRAAVLAGGIAALTGVVEHFTRANPITTFLLRVPLLQQTRADEVIVRGEDLRVMGTAEHPIAFGGVMALLLPLALWAALEAHGWKRALYGSATGVIASAMLFSVSRSAFVSAGAAFAVLLVVWPKRRKALLWLAVVGVFGIHMVFPGLLGTFRATLDPTYVMQQENQANARFVDYPAVFAIVPRQPLFGLGFGHFSAKRFFYLDNQYLKLLLELGIAGVAAFAWFALRALSPLIRAARAAPESAPLAGALLASASAFLCLSAFFDTFGFVQLTYVFFVVTALGVTLAASESPATAEEAIAA